MSEMKGLMIPAWLRILPVVEANPGITIRALSKRIDCCLNTVVYNVRLLVELGIIRMSSMDKRKKYLLFLNYTRQEAINIIMSGGK